MCNGVSLRIVAFLIYLPIKLNKLRSSWRLNRSSSKRTFNFSKMLRWIVLMRTLVLFIAMATIINLQHACGELHLTYHGTICIGACKLTSKEHYCESIDRGENEMKSMLCSPQSQTDVTGTKCKNECAKRGQDYYWCKTSAIATKWTGWGYCGLVRSNTNYVTSYYDALCYDHCAKRKNDYYWCHTRKGWDYCSPRTNVDYKNKPCKEDSQCAKHNQKYNWCYLKEGSWGYCGFLETKLVSYRTSEYRKICIDDCERKDYYYCYTNDGWDYCSPVPDITYKGVPCRDGHRCDLHGQNYYWCYTDTSNNWNYCGVIEGSQCEYHVEASRKRAVGGREEFQCYDRGNQRMTEFESNVNANIADGRQFQKDITNIIDRWKNDLLVNRARSGLVQTNNFRIDMQGMVERNGQRYHNLQIQRNVPRNSGQSTTFSQVLVPQNLEGVTDRYVRRAFTESFQRRVGITIKVSQIERQQSDITALNPPSSGNQLLHFKQHKLFVNKSTQVQNDTHA